MNTIKTKRDAKALIDNINLFFNEKVTENPQHSKFGFGVASIYRYNGNSWMGYYKNVITLRISYDEIIDFVYRHRKEISQNIRKLKHDVIDDTATKLAREYGRRLKLAFDRTGDERAKALLEVGYWDEDDVCSLLAQIEENDSTTAVLWLRRHVI